MLRAGHQPCAKHEETKRLKAPLFFGFLVAALTVSGCSRNPLEVKRSPCPAVAVPNHLGTVTQFDPADSRDASARALTAQISNLKGHCHEGEEGLTSDVRYTVTAQRRGAGAAQNVRLPIFVALVQGGNTLVSKEMTAIELHFPAGKLTAEAQGSAQAMVHRSATSLLPETEAAITRKRRADEADALVDPLADPKVQAAVRAATFEVLVGFQLDDGSVSYNISH